jgi:hypothetical protein
VAALPIGAAVLAAGAVAALLVPRMRARPAAVGPADEPAAPVAAKPAAALAEPTAA